MFGPVVSFGLGGAIPELLEDRAYQIPPITDSDAARLVRGPAAASILFGYGGSEPVDIAALEDLVLRLGRMSDELPALAQLDLNPVIVGRRGWRYRRRRRGCAPRTPRGDSGGPSSHGSVTASGAHGVDNGAMSTGVRDLLRRDIERSGYYPALVDDSLTTALGSEELTDFVVHHEATFDRDELRRHATVLALTGSRLIMQHTDEHPADESYPTPYATSVTEAVTLSAVDSVVVTRVVPTGELPTGRQPRRGRAHDRMGRGPAHRAGTRHLRRPGLRSGPWLQRHQLQRRPVTAVLGGCRR